MLKPTKTNQKAWIRKHLNGGILEKDFADHVEVTYKKEDAYPSHCHACYSAMKWLEEQGIISLEEAWNKCPRADWLDWILSQMDLSVEEDEALDEIFEEIIYDVDSIRKRILNPWVMENWKKGLKSNE